MVLITTPRELFLVANIARQGGVRLSETLLG